jgi:dihydroorotase
MSLVITGGRVFDPANAVDASDVYVATCGIAAVGQAPAGFQAGERVRRPRQASCAPGLIDLRARLREPGLEYKAPSRARPAPRSRRHHHAGCPPDTHPVIDTPAMAQMIQQRAWRGWPGVHPLGALTRGLEGKRLADMEALDEAGCVGFSNGRPGRSPTRWCCAAPWSTRRRFGLTVLLHAEDPWLRNDGCVHEGEVGTRLGLPASPRRPRWSRSRATWR